MPQAGCGGAARTIGSTNSRVICVVAMLTRFNTLIVAITTTECRTLRLGVVAGGLVPATYVHGD